MPEPSPLTTCGVSSARSAVHSPSDQSLVPTFVSPAEDEQLFRSVEGQAASEEEEEEEEEKWQEVERPVAQAEAWPLGCGSR